jgi:ribonuclease-3
MRDIEESLEYIFDNKKLLEEALAHPSITRINEDDSFFNYERLEFLGDSVLGLIIAELLIKKYKNEKEGALAKRQSGLIKGEAVANIARELNLGKYIKMTAGEESMGGRNNDSNLENSLEAIIGAIYLDGGLEPSRKFIVNHWANLVDDMKEPPKDPKTSLQELLQSRKLPIPEYIVVDASGPSHYPVFTIRLEVAGYESVCASGKSKKKAEKKVAKMMLEQIENVK